MTAKKTRLLITLFLLAGLLFNIGCKNKDDIPVPKSPEIVGIAAPFCLQPDSTTIELSDFFLHPKAIDSVFTDKNISFKEENNLRRQI